MKPKPLLSLNHLTVPVVRISYSPEFLTDSRGTEHPTNDRLVLRADPFALRARAFCKTKRGPGANAIPGPLRTLVSRRAIGPPFVRKARIYTHPYALSSPLN